MRYATLFDIKKLALAAKGPLWDKAQALGRDVKIYIHWTAGSYNTKHDDYTINIDKDGKPYVSTENFADVLAHTWRRNSGAIGIGLCCAYGANANDRTLGEYPPTEAQLDTCAQVITTLANALDLTIDVKRVMTHAEAADNYDGETIHEDYGPNSTCEKWDLAILREGDKWMTGGNWLRDKANEYRKAGLMK